MQILQDLIHELEVGEGRRYLPILTGILLFVAVLIMYNLREANSFASAEAMDAAQIARNLADGKGFSTHFIRPLSLKLVKENRPEEREDTMLLEGNHPDLANAPLWPALLAIAMKTLPFDFKTPPVDASDDFRRFQPEILIGAVNQLFFILSAILLFRLAKRLFDEPAAWFTTAVFLATDLLWQFCFSGLSTNFAIFLFLLLVHCLVSLERRRESENAEEKQTNGNPRNFSFYLVTSAVCGLLLACLILTRYSLGWLVIPAVAFLAFYLPGKRILSIGLTLLVFGIVVSPWLWRNYQWSGHPFGVAGYAFWQDTSRYPDAAIERTLQGEISPVSMRAATRKLLENSGKIAENEIPKLGGSWLCAFFLVGFLVPFHNKSLNRLRIFALLALLTLTIAQALSQTYLSRHPPEVNGQNLVILLLPLVYAFGAGLFFLLLDRLELSFFGAQFYASLLAVLLACLPLIFRFLPPRNNPVAYPPYWPPRIQQIGNLFGPNHATDTNELLMSDMPWAIGWYANKKCLWLTQSIRPNSDFYEIHDFHKSINGLYLTPITSDGKFLSQMYFQGKIQGEKHEWGHLYLKIFLNVFLGQKEIIVPEDWPLRHVDEQLLSAGQLFLTDWPRWNIEKTD